MSKETAKASAWRILEHCKAHDKKEISVILHGGEPLLGGVRHLETITDALRSTLEPNGVKFRYGMQSNGLLFSEDIGDFMLDAGLRMGISTDGTPSMNDVHRVDHKGLGSGERLQDSLNLITSDKYKSLLSGFLCVIDVRNDPIAIYEHLKSYSPPSIDFLVPYDNWDRLPPNWSATINPPIYGAWLVKLFDHWLADRAPVPIRLLKSLLRLLLGGKSLVESVGTGVVDLIVVETDGAIEAVDSIKACYDGAADLGFNVFDDTFDTVSSHASVLLRQSGMGQLSKKCMACDLRSVCGGGYIPTRYSAQNGFDNPSVYCRDYEFLIRHMHSATSQYAINEAV